MIRLFSRVALALVVLVVLAGCGQSPAPSTQSVPATAPAMTEPTAEAMVEPTAEAMVEPTAEAMVEPTAEAMVEPTAEPMVEAVERPAWQTLALTDARTGQSFTLADFAGKTVFVEPMATWCTKCRAQQQNVRVAREQLGSEQFAFVGLSVETNISAAELASYADREGFGWTFAVATPEMLQALVDAFGRTVANPPATPHFVIGPDGATAELRTGIEAPEALVQELSSAHGG